MLSEFHDRDPSRSALHLINMHEWNIVILISTNTTNTAKTPVLLWGVAVKGEEIEENS